LQTSCLIKTRETRVQRSEATLDLSRNVVLISHSELRPPLACEVRSAGKVATLDLSRNVYPHSELRTPLACEVRSAEDLSSQE